MLSNDDLARAKDKLYTPVLSDVLDSLGYTGQAMTPNIRPLDEALILRSVKKTNRCVIVEEGWPFASTGAEISHRIMAGAFDALDAPVVRVTGGDVPMPYAKNLEQLVLPTAEKVVTAVKIVLYRS